MKDRVFWEKVNDIRNKDGRFSSEAYEFISDAVVYAAGMFNRTQPDNRHVTGKELLEGIKVYAAGQFGPLAGEVFRDWGIKDSLSIGEIVFSLVDKGLLGKSDSDSLDDFRDGLDIDNDFSATVTISGAGTNRKDLSPPPIIA